MTYEIDGVTLHTRLMKRDRMSLVEIILCLIAFLGLVALIQVTVHMPIRALVYAVFALALIYWSTWIN